MVWSFCITGFTSVEASRHWGHCKCKMDASPQLNMVPVSFNLQKMFGQGVRTHPLMVLLAFISNISLFSLKSSIFGQERLPFFTVLGSFIVSGALSPLMVGRLLGLS